MRKESKERVKRKKKRNKRKEKKRKEKKEKKKRKRWENLNLFIQINRQMDGQIDKNHLLKWDTILNNIVNQIE